MAGRSSPGTLFVIASAVLAQRHPGWKAGDLKAALMGSAKSNPGNAPYAQGAGRVDVARAITRTVTTSPASISFGVQHWPHGDDTPDARTITYRNTGAADVALALSRATTTTLDARVSKPVSLTPPATDAAAVIGVARLDVVLPNGVSHQVDAFKPGALDGVYLGPSELAERQPLLTTSLTSQWIKGPVGASPSRPTSPYVYNLTEFFTDHARAGFTKRYTDRDLGRLDATYAGQGPTTGFTSMHAAIDERGVSTPSAVLPVTLPGRRAEYYTPNHSWQRFLDEGALMRDAASLHSPAGAWSGYSPTATGRIVVERDGKVIHDQRRPDLAMRSGGAGRRAERRGPATPVGAGH